MANNVIILGNGFDLDLGLNTSFKSFCESTYFRCLPDISFIKDLKTNNWSDVEGCIRKHLVEYSKNPNEELAESINLLWQSLEYKWGIFLTEQIELECVFRPISVHSVGILLIPKERKKVRKRQMSPIKTKEVRKVVRKVI